MPRVWVRVHLLGAGGRRGPVNRLSVTIDALDALAVRCGVQVSCVMLRP